MNATLQSVAKHSVIYSCVLSQPFAAYVDVYPALENKLLLGSQQLQYGEQGESVRVLQQKLNEQSYYAHEIDGAYGVRTEHAVKQFQKKHQLRQNGQMDKVTVEQLLEREKERYIEDIKMLSNTITPGMRSDDVLIVQEALAYFDYYEGNIDGIFGPLTMQAIQLAEEEHDLSLLSVDTVESLTRIYEEIEEQQKNEIARATSATSSNDVPKIEKTVQDEDSEKVATKNIDSFSQQGDVVNRAYDYIGTPYVWGGTSPSGFDCSGFLQFVFEQEDQTIPRTVSEIWNFSTPVDQPSVGDIVFFETYTTGPSHAGIYVGDGKFIHAGESRGVEVSELDQAYWQERYLGANRIH